MSLQIQSILSILTKDRQLELYLAIQKELLNSNNIKDIYIISAIFSHPTGGDMCCHEEYLYISGNYQNAKIFYDKYTGKNTIDEYGLSQETYYFYKGDILLNKAYYDYVNKIVSKKDYNISNNDNYDDLKYPIYQISYHNHYDTIEILGLYNNYQDALEYSYAKQMDYINEYNKKDNPFGFQLRIWKIHNIQDLNDYRKNRLMTQYNYAPEIKEIKEINEFEEL